MTTHPDALAFERIRDFLAGKCEQVRAMDSRTLFVRGHNAAVWDCSTAIRTTTFEEFNATAQAMFSTEGSVNNAIAAPSGPAAAAPSAPGRVQIPGVVIASAKRVMQNDYAPDPYIETMARFIIELGEGKV